ncbi:hypothetical protein OpiT1DRAFT_03849 [Opitutaceae bacterium TAV1]|nr:hypothetical protein OpiT1DRAFT_03849 [Opitutaceae bacterium TAV1]
MNKQFRLFGLLRWLMPIRLYAEGDGTGGGGGGGQQQQQQAAVTDLRSFIKDDGALNPGWAKALGGNEAWESKYTSLKAVLGAHNSLETMLGRDHVAIPTENAPPEEWSTFFAKVGRPEKPEGYEMKRPDGVPDEVWSDDRAKAFAEEAHKLGLSKKQAHALVAWQTAGVTAEIAAAQEKLASDTAALKAEWGADYDKNSIMAKHAIAKLAGADALNDSALTTHPVFVRIMAKVGAALFEGAGNLPGGRDQQGRFTGDPKTEIAKINGDKNDPYWDAAHPQHASRVEHMKALFARAYPG